MADAGDDEKLAAAIAALEGQRASLGDAVVEPALAALREQRDRARRTTDERKLVTILFADLAGFTALSEKLDPEDVRQLINACFERLVPIVQKYEGTIDKFIGDEIMALFGAPIAHEDDPERALRAALEMMEEIKALNAAHHVDLGMHIGINTGRVVAGSVGAKGRRDYSVMGDAVNLAARLEDASEVGEIFVGPATYRATEALFEFVSLPLLKLKGKQEPVEVHRLTGAKTGTVRRRGIEGLRAPITGRHGELEHIQSALAGLTNGRGAVIAILGEAGLGKSRLVGETRALCPESVKWSEGRALSYTTARSYWLVREVLLNLLGLKGDEASAKIASALEADLRRCLGETWADAYACLATVLDLALADGMRELVAFLSGEILQIRILEALRNYVARFAALQPLVMVWEDLHWSDAPSLLALAEMANLGPDVPLWLLITARLEDNSAAKLLGELSQRHPQHCRVLQLQPLNAKESSALVESLLNIDNLPSHLREMVVDRADGNPFFIEELLRSLLDADALVLERGRPKLVRPLNALEVPATLEEVVRARIDRLDPAHKETLQKASVVGRIFNRAVLTQLHSGNGARETMLDGALDQLQQRQFVQGRELRGSEAAALHENEFIFQHAITHDVAYESLLLAHRQELHAAVGSALERLFPDRANDLAATLGFHFERGAVADKAAYYLEQAADRARATFANTEAIRFYGYAIRALHSLSQKSGGDDERPGQMARLQEQVGDLSTLTGQHEQALVAFDQALQHLAPNDGVGRARIHRKIGNTHSLQRHFAETEQALAAADEILDQIEKGRDKAWWQEKLQVQLERMHLFYWQGMVPQMQELAERFRSAIDRNGTAAQQTKFLKNLSLAMLMSSRFRPSAECLELATRAVSTSEQIPDLYEKCYVQFTLGLIQIFRCELEDAVKSLSDALALAGRLGEKVLETRAVTYLALALRRQGDVAQAAAAAERALSIATNLAMPEYIAMANANLAWVARKEGRTQDCQSLGNKALEQWHAMTDPYSMDWIALWPLIAVAIEENDFTGAATLMRGLLRENQHPLDDDVMAAVRRAVESPTRKSLHDALVHARRRKYV